jgi:hypothetical protein
MDVQVIKLNPSDTAIRGKYRQNAVLLVECDATNAAFSVTLPDAKSIKNCLLIIKRVNATNAVTVQGLTGQTIDGADSYSLATQYDTVTLASDLSNWVITAKIVN